MADGPSIKELFGSDSDEEEEQVDAQVCIKENSSRITPYGRIQQPWTHSTSIAPHYLHHCR